MSALVARPTFYEGEILPAADLVATVDYSRDQIARHERYLHRWGIAAGLVLSGKSASTATGISYKTITLSAGVATDGTGREIVVPDDVQLNPSDFAGEVSPLPDPTVWYPVFLTGIDQNSVTSSNLIGACNTSLPTRKQESYEIHYGSAGSELNLDQQQGVGFGDGPGDGSTTDPWKVLLGFVQWSKDIPQFTDVGDLNSVSGVNRRYVGVNAADVVSGSGTVRLATHPVGNTGPGPVMAVEIHESNKGELVFGKQNADGTLTPVLTVSASGDLTASGKVSGAVTPGSMQVQSGMAFDGVAVPLPAGIDADAVTAGKVTLFTHVSLRLDQLQPPSIPPAGAWVPFPFECRVDSDTRQVHCRVQWWDMGATPALGPILPAFCDYTVIAAVAATTGSGA